MIATAFFCAFFRLLQGPLLAFFGLANGTGFLKMFSNLHCLQCATRHTYQVSLTKCVYVYFFRLNFYAQKSWFTYKC